MDWLLLILTLIVFIGALCAKIPIFIAFVCTFFAALLYIGICYPNARKDWPYSKKETVYLAFMCIFLICVVIIFKILLELVALPSVQTIAVYIILITLIIFLIVGVSYPKGLWHTIKSMMK